MNAKRIVALVFAFFVAINGFVITAAASSADIMSTEIVVVVDVSGSVAEYDAGYGVKDALSLMAGLAPDGAQAALVSVNADIAMDTRFCGYINGSRQGGVKGRNRKPSIPGEYRLDAGPGAGG